MERPAGWREDGQCQAVQARGQGQGQGQGPGQVGEALEAGAESEAVRAGHTGSGDAQAGQRRVGEASVKRSRDRWGGEARGGGLGGGTGRVSPCTGGIRSDSTFCAVIGPTASGLPCRFLPIHQPLKGSFVFFVTSASQCLAQRGDSQQQTFVERTDIWREKGC